MLPVNDQLTKVFAAGDNISSKLGWRRIDSTILTLAIIQEGTSFTATLLKEAKVDGTQLLWYAKQYEGNDKLLSLEKVVPNVKSHFTESLAQRIELTARYCQEVGFESMSVEALYLTLLTESDHNLIAALDVAKLNRKALEALTAKLFAHVKKLMAEARGESFDEAEEGDGPAQNKDWMGLRSKKKKESKTPTLDKFGRDLTALAKEGKLGPIIGRTGEIRRAVRIIGRKTKNNPVLVGEPGVGKTAIVEGIAIKFANDDVPKRLRGRKVIQIQLGTLIAGAGGRGEFEQRLESIVKELQVAGNIIVFFDELHTMIGAGGPAGGLDAANILKPALSRGELCAIGATTIEEYRKHVEKDRALSRRFQKVDVEPPSKEDTIEILRGVRLSFEEHHGVEIDDEAIVQAVVLSDRYVSGRFQPDKSIDLVDEACSKVSLEIFTAMRQDEENQSKPRVTLEHIAEILSEATGIPADSLTEDEKAKLLKLEDALHGKVIGQDRAIKAVSQAVRRSRVGLRDPNRPIGSFLFLGPTGVGKTELCRTLHNELFDETKDMIRLDMSEYMEKHSVSRLFGAPPGYVGYDQGGQLTEAVQKQPYAVVLFDEIEKAHPDVFDALLQILDYGKLTDGQGRTVDFRNVIIIMTSNAFADELTGDPDINVVKRLTALFKIEFLNRLDDILVFDHLTKRQIFEILDLRIAEALGRLSDLDIALTVEREAKEMLVTLGFSKEFGARELRRAIQRNLEDPLTNAILGDKIKSGDRIQVNMKDGDFNFEPMAEAA